MRRWSVSQSRSPRSVQTLTVEPPLFILLPVAHHVGSVGLQPGERLYPGQVYVNIGPLRTNLTFERKDSTVTLLKNDQVLINLLTDIVSEKRRATNIKPKIPSTFSHTEETREKVS